MTRRGLGKVRRGRSSLALTNRKTSTERQGPPAFKVLIPDSYFLSSTLRTFRPNAPSIRPALLSMLPGALPSLSRLTQPSGWFGSILDHIAGAGRLKTHLMALGELLAQCCPTCRFLLEENIAAARRSSRHPPRTAGLPPLWFLLQHRSPP